MGKDKRLTRDDWEHFVDDMHTNASLPYEYNDNVWQWIEKYAQQKAEEYAEEFEKQRWNGGEASYYVWIKDKVDNLEIQNQS